MKKWILIIFSLICLVLITVCNKITYFNLLLNFIFAILFLIISLKMYDLIFKRLKFISLKKELVILIGVLILNVLVFATVKFDNIVDMNLLIMIFNLLCYLFTLVVIYIYSRRLNDKSSAIFSLVLSSLILSVLYYSFINDIRFICLPASLLIFYVVDSFDYQSLFRKKNILRIGIVFILLFLSMIFNKYSLIAIVPFIFNVLLKSKTLKKWSLVVINIVLVIASYIISQFDIFTNIIKDYSSSHSFHDLFILMVFVTVMLSVISIKKRDFSKYLNIMLPIELVLLVIFKDNAINIINLIPIMILNIVCVAKDGYLFSFSIRKYFYNKKNVKKVSVVIPNYNYANYIEKRIDSVLKQKYPIYELIILDDCSKDDSVKVIEKKVKEIKDEYPKTKIKFIKYGKNSGNVFKQWQKAFELSKGDYLWIAEADDLSSKYFLNSVMRGFKDEEVVLSYCESCAIDEKGKIFKSDLRDWIDIYETGHWNRDYIVDGKEELKKVMCINDTIANVSSVVFKKCKDIDYEKYLTESQNFTLAGDWYFYSKVLLHGKIAYFSESLNYHRMHKNSVTNTTDGFVEYKEIVSMQDNIKNDVKIEEQKLNEIEDRRNRLIGRFSISEDEFYYDKINLEDLVKQKEIKDEILLSIIIPVYNVEKYIDKCLKSVFKDLPIKTEVIIINDGSPDNSEDIILKYKEKYEQIKYIKKKNGGLSSVKNLGLKEAKGRYVIYLDSDDYVSSNMYSTMLKKAIDTNSDIVYCDVLMVYEDGSQKYWCMANLEHKNELMQMLDNPLMAASWNKMVKKELYNGLDFPEGINNEDVAVSPILYLRSKKIVRVNSPFYKYVQRSGSIQNSGFSEKRFMIFDTAKICFERMKNESSKTKEMVTGYVVTHQILGILIYLISKLKKEEKMKYIELFCKRYNELNICDNNKYIDEYLKKFDLSKLLMYIKNNDYSLINKELKKVINKI